MFKQYYCIKQHDITDCGAACLATISKQYGLKKSISKIRQIAGTDKKGTNAYGLIKAAKHLGFTAKGVKATPEQFSSDLPLPAIAHVIKDNLLHFVVIHKINKNNVIIADPAEGLITYLKKDFFKIWSGVLILMVPGDQFEKENDKTDIFERFLSIILYHKKLIFQILFASILFTLFGIMGAFYFKFLIDEILINGIANSLHVISIGILILTVFKVLMDAFRKHLLLYLSQKIDVSLILSYYKHVLQMPLSFFDTRKVGEILSRLNDASKIRAALSGATLSILIDTLMVIGGGIVLYIQNATLFFIALFLIPFSAIVVWIFTKPFQKINKKQMSQAADTEAYLVESLSGISTVKAMNAECEALHETEKRFIKFIKTTFKSFLMQNIQFSLQEFLTLFGGIIILWIGGIQVMQGNLSIGQLITFNALLVYFLGPIKNLINLQPILQEAIVAAERLGEILDLKIESKNDDELMQLDKINGYVEFKNVNFRYGTRELVLKDISFKIKAGEKIAIVGESGSGKTTFIKLLLKYYLPEKGEILIDDNNIKDIQTQVIRQKIGYVPQEVFLFSGTIRENIAFGQNDVSFNDIVKAAQDAQSHEFISNLPLRYNTLIGERGATLSGGQRQRIALARAVLGSPDMLILDEATSSLDSIAEKAIHKTIDNLSTNITTFIIAHRLSTIMKSDRIIVFDKGEIVEHGTHMDLLLKKGKYWQLWQGQMLEEDYNIISESQEVYA